MGSSPLLLVEDNPEDEALTVRALIKNNIKNGILLARDDAEALDCLFATGPYACREVTSDHQLPQVGRNESIFLHMGR